ncbi:hypothetical protein HPP92_021517 [Vanilla planifolia]|uniref:Uncharacterized protein n=1 Tax=Vanilla planifolia TaxID=51239 RepID=A0A835PYU3_VANPL|nr:hypothetical protein HPP92_021882 [Vanilla planifolia]KAG0463041.1 hypothetical protein HPP92_021517 [Vanilla planifolia]
MEEAKAAAYYDELTRKGEGAARFKQGLGFSSYSSDSIPTKPSSSSPSPFSNFVRASSPGKAAKQAQLENIQAKLRRPRRSPSPGRRSPEPRCRSRERDHHGRGRHSSSRERRRERDGGRRSRSRDRRRRSRSYSEEEGEEGEGYRRGRNDKREKESLRRGGRSRSPCRVTNVRDRNWDRRRDDRSPTTRRSRDSSDKVDYSLVIEGYSNMTPAERVKAKMKFQLSRTAAKDSTIGMSSGWERFDFNKDAPLDDGDDEIEDNSSLPNDSPNVRRRSRRHTMRRCLELWAWLLRHPLENPMPPNKLIQECLTMSSKASIFS